MGQIKHIHMIGVAGAGMSGIAEILCKLGYTVSGSDLSANYATENLTALGGIVFKGHAAEQVSGADVVVISSAIKQDNVEYQAAQKIGIPIIPRAQMLAEMMRFRHGITVAGTHGKTTTTSLLTDIFINAGLKPSYVIGGRLASTGRHADLGVSDYLLVEADESDASFLFFNPMQTIVTNIDADHMATYDGDFTKLVQAFKQHMEKLPFYGEAVVCIDCPVLQQLSTRIQRPMITYGLSDAADISARNIRMQGRQSFFDLVVKKDKAVHSVQLNLPGEHNIANALAVYAIAKQNGIDDEVIFTTLAQFKGVGRRFQYCGEINLANGSATHFDDYGHHPQEIMATIKAVRSAWPQRRLVLAFQPHRYSRTHDLFQEFVTALSQVDKLILLNIYSAGEEAIAGISSEALLNNLRNNDHCESSLTTDVQHLAQQIQSMLQADDILITQGAGDIGRCPSIFSQQGLYADSMQAA
jgi:UDP-N-acetylmuramate--alanine ligase